MEWYQENTCMNGYLNGRNRSKIKRRNKLQPWYLKNKRISQENFLQHPQIKKITKNIETKHFFIFISVRFLKQTEKSRRKCMTILIERKKWNTWIFNTVLSKYTHRTEYLEIQQPHCPSNLISLILQTNIANNWKKIGNSRNKITPQNQLRNKF